MKVLIIFVHESHKSFNAALLDTAVKTLKDAGHEVTVSDLYAMKFNNTPSQADITDGVKNKDAYDYQAECKGALSRGTLAADIVAEHKKIDAADLIIFQFPINWYSYPAMLKGYVDRVMTSGYAFSYYPELKIFDIGVFRNKKAVLSITTGGPAPSYTEVGMHGAFNIFLWPFLMMLYHMGFQVLRPQVSFGVKFADDATRKGYLDDWHKRVSGPIWTEEPLSQFFRVADFDASKGFVLKDEVVAAHKAKDQKAPTTGTHLGLPEKTPWQDAL